MAGTQRRASETIAVSFDPHLCIHSARCLQGLPEVFNFEARPWIQPQNSDADAVAETVQRCPSGALTFERLDGGPGEAVSDETTIQNYPNGPLLLRGHLRFANAHGETIREANRAAICRCGGSQNKPFCDGTHRRNGFEAE